MIEAGFFRLCVPASLGGGEADAGDARRGLRGARARRRGRRLVHRGDARPPGMLAAYIPEDAAREVYGDAALGGRRRVRAQGPRAVADGDDYRVTGRWPFSSGVDHCDWLMGGCIVDDDGAPRCSKAAGPTSQPGAASRTTRSR